jgi:hypothetical protein
VELLILVVVVEVLWLEMFLQLLEDLLPQVELE